MGRPRITAAQVLTLRGEDTQSELAQRLGASSAAVVSRWEHGKTQPSRRFARELAKLAKVRGVDLEATGA